jgi:hypothetical protein
VQGEIGHDLAHLLEAGGGCELAQPELVVAGIEQSSLGGSIEQGPEDVAILVGHLDRRRLAEPDRILPPTGCP